MPPRLFPLTIEGQPVATGDLLQVHSPYDGQLVGEVHRAGPAELARAMDAAVRVAPTLAAQSAADRIALLQRIRAGLATRQQEFADTIIAEGGKPRRYAEGEVARALSTLEYAIEEAGRIGGEIVPLGAAKRAAGHLAFTQRFPVGPVIGISPFNFPLNLMLHKIAPAIAAGCPIIHKPASTVPLTAMLLDEVIAEAGRLPGQVAILPTESKTVGPLIDDPRFKALSFTGSAEVGWELKRRAHKKRVTLELGGNAAAILAPDADWESALPGLVDAAYAYAGQVCISLQRLFIHASHYDAVITRLIELVDGIAVGDPDDPATVVGPLITAGDVTRIESWIGEAVAAGARVMAGGGETIGQIVRPVLLEDVPVTARLSCEEAFGPVLLVQRYSDFSEALRWVNDSAYGLQASVYTNDLAKTLHAFRTLEVGGVMINEPPTFRVDSMPYGGVKESGFGREGIRYAIEETYTEMRLCVVKG